MYWFILSILLSNFRSDLSPNSFVWKNRIVVYSGNGDFSSWQSESEIQDLTDRKLLYFHFKSGKLFNSNYEGRIDEGSFLKKLGDDKNFDEKWVLIGLDGGIKKSGKNIPVPGEIFRIIDAMPMRQSEIRGRD